LFFGILGIRILVDMFVIPILSKLLLFG